MTYTLDELKKIVSDGLDEVHNNISNKEKVVKYYKYLYKSQGCKCKIPNVDINNMFNKLKDDGIKKLEEIENRKFHLRDNVIPIRVKGVNIDNVNLTDELAMKLLKENENRISLFKIKPENWQEVVAEFFYRTPKRKMKRRKPRKKNTTAKKDTSIKNDENNEKKND
ncbi:hypothetical protein [Galbibacter pacificus]|uniref:Uncharacterized protein n=1 Tax=Galbibacter pacificus TaxID=2996052 RepID=A0ABT6FR62_9FLAO|nr:hypothetical protein [Galbibacter pacificus]MDG3581771.1 hypothetical protein [Galbibacter pacificus]MDG3585755.1 hypothetical protein [Galbibacter pacificus]